MLGYRDIVIEHVTLAQEAENNKSRRRLGRQDKSRGRKPHRQAEDHTRYAVTLSDNEQRETAQQRPYAQR
ncbi:MAG: hypothetical protein JXB35_15000 [Anaerolineae bacterium]|nr:hypothetical protein [Anaerolineae bacterium]